MKQEIDNNAMWAAFRQELALQGELQVVAAIDNALNNLGFTIEETSTIVPIPLKQGEKKPVISDDALREGIAHFGITQYQIDNWLKKYVDIEKQGEQKPAEWSEEDEEIVETLNEYVKNLDILFSEIKIGNKDILSKEFRKKVQSWLKSLKERVQPQPKQWSEEDDQYLLVCKNALAKYQVSDKWDAIIISRWLEDKLKSLRPQNTWKPSDEQIKALADALSLAKNCGEEIAFDLRTLHEQLKKLREE